ncbi:MAG: PspC domain-containing protein [Bacteroidales bacterium]|jgi:phage shock protein PspC (stress-responsive transcriptional regulator)
MDKTISINLGGILFQIDEEAFRILRDYLQKINNHFGNAQGGHETIEDIESRIAEIFQSQKGLAGVVTRENVEAMISIIGKPEDFDHVEPETGAPVYTSEKRRMYRNRDDFIISGVCGGIGAYLDTDPVLFRILFIISAMFGVGLLVYVALWIALPVARTDSQKREMFGSSYHSTRSQDRQYDNTIISGSPQYHTEYKSSSRVGNAINEIFRAVGRVFYIILRIFLIIIGVVLVLTGFLSILCFVLVFIFKFPGVFSIDSSGINLINFTDFLNYIVTPASVPWITILASFVFILPMIALIYWGVKMIFWFKARDGVVSLVALVIWVMAIAALTIIGFNEGISFAKTAETSAETILKKFPDTLYIMSENKIADLKFEKDFTLPHEEYSVYINDEKKELYVRSYLSVDRSDDKSTRIEVKKRAAGRTELEAMKKTEGLIYNYRVSGDTLHLDEYFTSPAGRKWSADEVGINLFIPVGTVIKFEKNPKILLHSSFRNESDEYLKSTWESENGTWVMTRDGLEPNDEYSVKHK